MSFIAMLAKSTERYHERAPAGPSEDGQDQLIRHYRSFDAHRHYAMGQLKSFYG
jgi:hypothetical protein